MMHAELHQARVRIQGLPIRQVLTTACHSDDQEGTMVGSAQHETRGYIHRHCLLATSMSSRRARTAQSAAGQTHRYCGTRLPCRGCSSRRRERRLRLGRPLRLGPVAERRSGADGVLQTVPSVSSMGCMDNRSVYQREPSLPTDTAQNFTPKFSRCRSGPPSWTSLRVLTNLGPWSRVGPQ